MHRIASFMITISNHTNFLLNILMFSKHIMNRFCYALFSFFFLFSSFSFFLRHSWVLSAAGLVSFGGQTTESVRVTTLREENIGNAVALGQAYLHFPH